MALRTRTKTLDDMKQIVFIRAAPMKKTGARYNGYHAGLFFTDGWAGPFLRHEVFIKAKNIGSYEVVSISDFLADSEGRNLMYNMADISDSRKADMLINDLRQIELSPEQMKELMSMCGNATHKEPDNEMQELLDVINDESLDGRKKIVPKKRVLELLNVDVGQFENLSSAWDHALTLIN